MQGLIVMTLNNDPSLDSSVRNDLLKDMTELQKEMGIDENKENTLKAQIMIGQLSGLIANMAKWMTGIIHAYSLFSHPILADKPVGKRIAGLIPVLHMTLFRMFLVACLPAVVLLSRSSVVPTCRCPGRPAR